MRASCKEGLGWDAIQRWLTARAVQARLGGATEMTIHRRTGVGFFAKVATWNLLESQVTEDKARVRTGKLLNGKKFKKRSRVSEPILLKALCTKLHGKEVEVRA